MQKDKTQPKAAKQIEVTARGLSSDGWIAPSSFIRVKSSGPIWISLFLPGAADARETKKVAVFDGTITTISEVNRNKLTRIGPFSSKSGEIDLHIVCEYSEISGAVDKRKLGVVLGVLGKKNIKLLINRKDFDEPFTVPLNHPDAQLVALEFDQKFYLTKFKPEDRPENPLLHYLLLGWQTGCDPTPDFSVAEYATETPLTKMPERNPLALEMLKRQLPADVEVTEDELDDPELDTLWASLAGDALKDRPSCRFDPAFYSKHYRDIADSGMAPEMHFKEHGFAENRLRNLYGLVGTQIPGLRQKIVELLSHEKLAAMVIEERRGALELAFELLALGSPVDQEISDFCADFYLESYADIRDAGTVPVVHYLGHGLQEGRKTLASVRSKMFAGQKAYDPDLPTCLICTHEFSKTGAPMVALDMVKEASLTHNVVVAALRAGELRPAFAPYCMVMLTTAAPFEEFQYFNHEALPKIEFAILNSVECWAFSKFLVSRNIPYASYIHEYTDYTRPTYKSKFICWFSDVIVYSSDAVRDSWAPSFREAGFNSKLDSSVIPQHHLIDGSVTQDDYLDARARLSDLLGVDCADRRIIYGAGQIQIRKGTDLFIMAAQQAAAIDPDALFIWIGDGYNHEDMVFGVWLDKHLREAKVNTKDSNIFFFPAGPYYLDLCKAADAMFMSSRIDPLPNVVFDATLHGAAVVLFDGSSGFDDAIYSDSTLLKRVEFGRLDSACSMLLETSRKVVQSSGVMSAAPDPIIKPSKDDEGPQVAPFHEIYDRLISRLKGSYNTVPPVDQYDVPMMYSSGDNHADFRKLEREKVRRYGRQMIWSSAEAALDAAADKGGWMHEGTKIIDYDDFPEKAKMPAFSIHNHAFYLDGLEDEIASYAFYHHAQRIVFTTDTQNKARRIVSIGKKHGLTIEALVVRNQGRDILPFIKLVSGPENEDEPDDHIWCHIHRKKSISSATTGDVWWAFLMSILAGGNLKLSSALAEISKDDIGMVTAFDPYIIGWDDAARLLPRFADRFEKPLPPHPVLFPVGNMFWVKTGVVRQMNEIFGENYPWPNEPIANDGTEYHLMERLWPAATKLAGLSSLFVDKKGQKRA